MEIFLIILSVIILLPIIRLIWNLGTYFGKSYHKIEKTNSIETNIIEPDEPEVEEQIKQNEKKFGKDYWKKTNK
jgi:hypothetical protein